MSYSRNYSASVPYSGTARYTYPASQSSGSGTVSYSGSVPVNITINVDTRPFDGSVHNFNSSVNVLSGSVVALQAAHCAAITKAANDVSDSIINGFFGTINLELTQQLQALDSAIKASFGLLVQQDKAVGDKKNVMESDYNRISSRYINLFSDLDSECYKRIYALDRQSFTLSEKVQKELLSETGSSTAALNLLGIEEITSSRILVLISSLNRKALEVLRTLQGYITQESRMNTLVNSLLSSEEVSENTPYYVPVLWIESDVLEKDGLKQESFTPDYIQAGDSQSMAEKTDSFCSQTEESSWLSLEADEKEILNREYNSLSESFFTNLDDETEQRIYKTMLSLWNNSNMSSLKRSV